VAGRLGVRPTKRLGQNFVVEQGTVRQIAALAAPRSGDVILEVGPGLGSLTLALLEAMEGLDARLIAVEIDPLLAAELPRTIADRAPGLADRTDVVAADALKIDALPLAPTVLAANLPYNVAVPVVLHLLAVFPSLARGVIMVQAEVADRMCAGPGSRVYGVPSAKLAWYASARAAGTVPRSVFWPVPNVDSKLVVFARHDRPPTTASREEVFAVIDAAFGQRRKTLRADGFHGLVTVFHAISLFDQVTVAPAEADSVAVSGEGVAQVPADGDNLALRAVRALRAAIASGSGSAGSGRSPVADGEPGVAVTIRKKIPVAAGLAGGSADAAAALVACNELWQARLSQQELCEVASAVGSDVAFSVLGGTAVGRGRGERLTPALVSSARYHWVLAYADGELSTPAVYGALDRLRGGDPVPEPGLSAELMSALRAGDAPRLGRALVNDLQAPAVSMFPALRKTLAAGSELGALGALVSGSGPTCVFLARGATHATDLAVALSGAGVCRSVTRAAGPASGATVIER
jgi:ribosomal RNA small subunit methyltransferase A